MNIKDSIVKITLNGGLLGTGFYISRQGYVLTCAHLFKTLTDNEIEKVQVNNQKAEVKDRQYSENKDFAVLKVRFAPI